MPVNGDEKMEYKIFGNAQSSENPYNNCFWKYFTRKNELKISKTANTYEGLSDDYALPYILNWLL